MIKLPKIKGVIDRRILINYRIKVEILKSYLPAPFEPVEVAGYGIAGICLIRLKNVRPVGLPAFLGMHSENGAHRIAVKWKENGTYQEGVYIPRRDTSLKLNEWAGGRIFPGVHHFSKFEVNESNGQYRVGFTNEDGTHLRIVAEESGSLPKTSIFPSLEEVSFFLKKGSLGYSPGKQHCFDGLELNTYHWKVSPLAVTSVQSSFFEDETIFSLGSVEFDNALLMKSIEHEWIMRESMPQEKRK